jgi:Ca2+:H+ antiporter
MLHKTCWGLPWWSVMVPFIAGVTLAAGWGNTAGWMLVLIAIALVASVLVSVHHAEVIALRVGEPLGTLILAMAVTLIETALIVTMMLSGGEGAGALARDTVFAAVMIVCNGVVGLCLLAGGIRHRVLVFRIDGTGPALSVLTALATLSLVLPTHTTTTPGPTFSTAQLVFAGLASLALYGVFIFVQTVRHRDYFLPTDSDSEDLHAPRPSAAIAWTSVLLLLISLVAVVGLAKLLSPSIRQGVEAADAPLAVVGIAIALLVLLPETVAAVRAAVRNRMQTSLNLALGSVLATIGLTIPVVAAVSLVIGMPLELGLSSKETVMLVLTLFVSAVTLATGRATIMQGAVHLVVFAAFLFLAVVP